MSRGISTSDKVLAPAFVTNIFVTRTFWAGAIRKINKCAIKEIKSIIANVNKNITNQEVYNANKVAVRADIAEFETKVYEVEDELLASKTLEISSVALQVDGEIIAKTINNKKVGK